MAKMIAFVNVYFATVKKKKRKRVLDIFYYKS